MDATQSCTKGEALGPPAPSDAYSFTRCISGFAVVCQMLLEQGSVSPLSRGLRCLGACAGGKINVQRSGAMWVRRIVGRRAAPVFRSLADHHHNVDNDHIKVDTTVDRWHVSK